MSFGHAGFYAIGAYTVAILTGQAGWSFWLAWPAAALVAGAFGLLLALPALRVKGPYLAMITIAFERADGKRAAVRGRHRRGPRRGHAGHRGGVRGAGGLRAAVARYLGCGDARGQGQ
ncbi:hypothetical protein G6F59_017421 [Rhizopus arrhizus]|nr:hypothetical protein G6F59_017421 [Rhizopus arrhizus]